jgi:hypothetical protein
VLSTTGISRGHELADVSARGQKEKRAAAKNSLPPSLFPIPYLPNVLNKVYRQGFRHSALSPQHLALVLSHRTRQNHQPLTQRDDSQKEDADCPIDRKERSVDPAKIVRIDEAVFVEQE